MVINSSSTDRLNWMINKDLFKLFKKPDSEESNLPLEKIILIAGLGNPGKQYSGNRHNVGFMAVDHIINKLNFSGKKIKSKSVVVEGRYNNMRIIFSKPQTFMNLSGDAIVSLMKFYKIQTNQVLVVHDDIDLPFGVIRLRPSGGAGGQKGLSSIINRLGTKEFARLRVGVGRPPGNMDPADYVLKDFNKTEREELPFIFDSVYKMVITYLDSGLETAMNLYNGTVTKEE